MVRLYLMLIVLAVLGSVGAGAFWYYKDTQQRIATLQENNAKLEVALETSEESINALQEDIQKFAAANKQLQEDLKKAEKYGDDLRNKLRQLDLVQDAIKDPENLQGRMNGASAKLWRGIMAETGDNTERPFPEWLQPNASSGTEGPSSDQGGENSGTDGSKTEASPVN